MIIDTVYHELKVETQLTADDFCSQQHTRGLRRYLQLLRKVYNLQQQGAKRTSHRLCVTDGDPKTSADGDYVPWDPRTYARTKSREIYKPRFTKSTGWVDDIRDFVPSLPFKQHHMDIDNETGRYLVSNDVTMENLDRLIDLSKTKVHIVDDNTSNKNSIENIVESTSADGDVSEEKPKTSTPTPHSYLPGSFSHSHLGKDPPAPSNYKPPRWSDILHDELKFREQNQADQNVDKTFEEMYQDVSRPGSRSPRLGSPRLGNYSPRSNSISPRFRNFSPSPLLTGRVSPADEGSGGECDSDETNTTQSTAVFIPKHRKLPQIKEPENNPLFVR